MGCDLKKGTPKPFQDFCHQAKISGAGIMSESVISFDCNDGPRITANLVEGKLTNITGQVIQRSQPSFNGVDLADRGANHHLMGWILLKY